MSVYREKTTFIVIFLITDMQNENGSTKTKQIGISACKRIYKKYT